jgi:hypothetical protein
MSTHRIRQHSSYLRTLTADAQSLLGAAAPAITTNDTSWAILYGAMIGALGASPKSFQLVYPFTSWNWPTTNTGFTSAQQYDFCATIPQWSAVGQYTSSGATFDTSYQQFLNEIMLSTSNPQLAQQIVAAQNSLTQAANNLGTVQAQATLTYQAQVPGNVPSYTEWLGGAGISYGVQISALTNQLIAAQNVYNALVNQQTTPNIAQALSAMANQNYYTKLVNSGLSGFPAAPAWDVSTTAAAWVQQVQGGGGTGGSISFGNSSAAYNYSNTWAQGSASVGDWFWQVQAGGSWSQASVFQTDSSLTCNISFAAWDTIQITPSLWYSGVVAFQNGPFQQGFTAYKQPGTNYAFGEGGLVPCLKTSMIVAYQPTVTITVSNATFQSFQSQWSAATGISVGPFSFSGQAGGSQLNWSQSGSNWSLKVASTSTVPVIIGVNVKTLP